MPSPFLTFRPLWFDFFFFPFQSKITTVSCYLNKPVIQNWERRWSPTITIPMENVLVSTSWPVYKCYMGFFFNKNKIYILQGWNLYFANTKPFPRALGGDLVCQPWRGSLAEASSWCCSNPISPQYLSNYAFFPPILDLIFCLEFYFSSVSIFIADLRLKLNICSTSHLCSALCYGGTQSVLQNLSKMR